MQDLWCLCRFYGCPAEGTVGCGLCPKVHEEAILKCLQDGAAVAAGIGAAAATDFRASSERMGAMSLAGSRLQHRRRHLKVRPATRSTRTTRAAAATAAMAAEPIDPAPIRKPCTGTPSTPSGVRTSLRASASSRRESTWRLLGAEASIRRGLRAAVSVTWGGGGGGGDGDAEARRVSKRSDVRSFVPETSWTYNHREWVNHNLNIPASKFVYENQNIHAPTEWFFTWIW